METTVWKKKKVSPPSFVKWQFWHIWHETELKGEAQSELFCGKLQWHKWKYLLTMHRWAANSAAVSTSKIRIKNSFRKGLTKLMETDQSGAIKHSSLRCTVFLPEVDKVSQRKNHTMDLSFLKLFPNHLSLATAGNRTQSSVNILTKSVGHLCCQPQV